MYMLRKIVLGALLVSVAGVTLKPVPVYGKIDVFDGR